MSNNNLLKKAGGLTRQNFGKKITAYLPGMFSYNGLKGRYPAISITGKDCLLQCDHCMGIILESMIPAESPERLVEKAVLLEEEGNHGILISGGCDRQGRLPWKVFIPAIRQLKDKTSLFVSIHCGILDDVTALELKEAGVDQVLMDVIGDDETYQRVFHVDFGVSMIIDTMKALKRAGFSVIPHLVCGLFHGRMKSEKKALEMISWFDPKQLVIVSLMAIPGTPLEAVDTPKSEDVAEIIAEARLMMPDTLLSLGCARKRGDSRLEILAIDAGINRIALPSEEALSYAKEQGLYIKYQRTCCSVSKDFSGTMW
jgi:uncharacterized radical SAM superfamily protein